MYNPIDITSKDIFETWRISGITLEEKEEAIYELFDDLPRELQRRLILYLINRSTLRKKASKKL